MPLWISDYCTQICFRSWALQGPVCTLKQSFQLRYLWDSLQADDLLVWEEVESWDICPGLKTVSAICMNVFQEAMLCPPHFLDEFNRDLKERHCINSYVEACRAQCVVVTPTVTFIINIATVIIPDTVHAFKLKLTILLLSFLSSPPRNSSDSTFFCSSHLRLFCAYFVSHSVFSEEALECIGFLHHLDGENEHRIGLGYHCEPGFQPPAWALSFQSLNNTWGLLWGGVVSFEDVYRHLMAERSRSRVRNWFAFWVGHFLA